MQLKSHHILSDSNPPGNADGEDTRRCFVLLKLVFKIKRDDKTID